MLYWYDPMVPDQHFDQPGRSPFMDMALVPRYADEAPAEAGVRIDPGVVQNLGVRLANVESAPVARTVAAAGVIMFSERAVAVVQARASRRAQRGVALLGLLAVAVMVFAYVLTSRLNAASRFVGIDGDHNARVLARAKQALIGYMAQQAAMSGLQVVFQLRVVFEPPERNPREDHIPRSPRLPRFHFA